MSVYIGTADFVQEKVVAGAKITGLHESMLQECEKDIIWYRDNFFGKAHINLLASETKNGAMAVSVVKDADHFKVLVRTGQGAERLIVPQANLNVPFYRRLFGLGPSVVDIISAASNDLPVANLVQVKDVNLPNILLQIEERQVIRSYKFGLCYIGPGQSTEEEMFDNRMENTSPEFKRFLSFLGEEIELKGWKGYRAGLDVTEGQTGTHSTYTKWQGYEIMFHTSVHLPHNPDDPQKLERKRHVGNDIVVIIFQDSDVPFNLPTLTSKQNHLVFIVKSKDDGYTMAVCRKNGVPEFSPELPDPTFFDGSATSREFFLHKLVNGERACYKAPNFAPKIARTRAVLLNDVAVNLIKS